MTMNATAPPESDVPPFPEDERVVALWVCVDEVGAAVDEDSQPQPGRRVATTVSVTVDTMLVCVMMSVTVKSSVTVKTSVTVATVPLAHVFNTEVGLLYLGQRACKLCNV